MDYNKYEDYKVNDIIVTTSGERGIVCDMEGHGKFIVYVYPHRGYDWLGEMLLEGSNISEVFRPTSPYMLCWECINSTQLEEDCKFMPNDSVRRMTIKQIEEALGYKIHVI